MKKNYLVALLFILCSGPFWAQNTETFESYTSGRPTSFTNAGQTFTILTNSCGAANGGIFGIFVPGQSYNICTVAGTSTGTGYGVGTACASSAACASVSDKFIDNGNSNGTSQVYSIKTTPTTSFTIKSLYVYVSTNHATSSATSGVTFRGKKAGVGTFTYTPASLSTNTNGFTYIDFVAAGYGSFNIDELEIQGGASVNYLAIDNFTWGAATPPLTATTSQTNIPCSGGTGHASVSVSGGTAPYTYAWAPSGGSGATTSAVMAGTYTCTITDAGSSTITQTVNITQPSALVASFASQTNIGCFGGNNGAASVLVTGGTTSYSYDWAPGTPTGDGTASVTGLAANNWTCTVTDAHSCTATRVFAVTQPAAALVVNFVSQLNIGCFGASTGSASASTSGGTTPYSYNWTPGNPAGDGSASITGLAAGNWTCTVTDLNSCAATKVFTVTQPSAALSAATGFTDVSCPLGVNGRASVTVSGGTPSYGYSWAPSGGSAALATGLGTGTYTCTITDANSCSITKTVSVGAPSAISATSGTTAILCNSGTGTASVSVSGGTPGYNYSWAPSGGSGAVTSAIGAGTYTCTITDNNSCTATKTVSLVAPTAINATTGFTNTSCPGGVNGRASVSASGGTPGYTYTWTPSGGNASLATGLSSGTYTCTIKDANNCSITATVNVGAPSAFSVTSGTTAILCNGGTGTASVSVSGGTSGYNYSWVPSGGSGAVTSAIGAGTYTCTITDANSCTTTKTVSLVAPTVLSVTGGTTAILCNGGTGTASVSVSGGTPGYNYSWAPSGGTGAITSAIGAGTYTCTITDANSCTTTKTVSLVAPTALSVTGGTTAILCNGGTGTASVSVSGGTPGYNYSWAPSGGAGAVTSAIGAGTYTCTITDANSCSITKTVSLVAPSAITATSGTTAITCATSADGTASVSSVSGGTGTYTYSWTPSGGTAATASGLGAGTYTCTIKDANSCSITKTVSLVAPSAITATSGTTAITCATSADGTASVSSVSGGTGTYTYSWAPSGGTGSTASGLGAGTYTCTIKDANSCTTTKTVSLVAPLALSATSGTTAITCATSANGTASVSVSGGTGAYTYSWTPSGGTAATASGLGAGTYTCTIKDANSCSITKTVSLVAPSAITATSGTTAITCATSGDGTASVSSVSGGTGTYTYSWTPSGGTAATASGLGAGTYTCTIKDANSCSITKTVSLVAPSAITATSGTTAISCATSANGTASVSVSGGTGTYTYSWTPSGGTGSTASGLGAGTYTCTIKDANSCSITKTVSLVAPSPITATSGTTAITCATSADGTASVSGVSGGTGAYTYSWTPSGGTAATASGLGAGAYTCTIKDANSCTTTKTVSLVAPSALSATTSFTNVSCNGGNNGIASVSASGGTPAYTYSWSPGGGTAATATGLTSGNYTCTITDNHGCALSQTVTLTPPPAITVSAVGSSSVTCNSGNNGTATVSVSGGTPGYTYNWTPGNPTGDGTASVSGLGAGTWTCAVNDANGCVNNTTTFVIAEPASYVITAATPTDVSCNGGNTGALSITGVSGGTAPYTYSWTPAGGSSATASNLVAGSYTCTITDNHSCTTTKVLSVSEPLALSATSATTGVSCNGNADGTATVSVSGGTTPYTYSWSPTGGSASTTSGLTAGSYTCFITDNHSCMLSQTVTVIEPAALSATAGFTNVSCNGGSTGSASVSISGGTAPYTYSWSPTGGSAASASGLTAGNYTCTVTDNHGCVLTQSISLSEPGALFALTGSSNVGCNGGSTGSASVSISGGTAPYTYSWSPTGGSAASASGLAAGDYTCTTTDNNGCTLASNFSLTEPMAMTATTTQTDVSCNGGNNGAGIINVSGGTAPYSYTWTPGSGTTATVTALTAGTYTCFTMDNNGCAFTTTLSLSEPAAIVSTPSQTNVTCNGNANGTADVSVTGGTPAYSYSWSPSGGNAATATGLAAADYTCTITDNNNCSVMQLFTISEPAVLAAIASQTNITCTGGGSDGATSVSVSGGTAPYSYTWSPSGGNAATATGLASDTYTCMIADNNGCSLAQTFTLSPPMPIAYTQSVSICQGQSLVVGTSTYSAAGTFTDVLTAANACDSTVTSILTVNALPTLTTTASNTVVCEGSSVTLTSVGATTYTWTGSVSNGVAFVPAGTDTYTVDATDSNGCTAEAMVTVTVNPAPTVTASATSSVVCTGQQTTLTAGGTATTYTWTGGVTDGVAFTPAASDTYTVTGTNADNCSSMATVSITVSTCTGVDALAGNGFVRVYPNPFSTSTVIRIDNQLASHAAVSFDLYDNTGRLVKHTLLDGTQTELKRGELATGLYFYNILDGKNIVSKGKLIIE